MKDYSLEQMQILLSDVMGGRCRDFMERSDRILETIKMSKESEQVSLLAYVLGFYKTMSLSKSFVEGRKISRERFNELEPIIEDALREFHDWLRDNPSCSELAEKLWRYMARFDDVDTPVVVLACILEDDHIPYCQIPDSLFEVPLSPEAKFEAEMAIRDQDEDGMAKGCREEWVLLKNIMSRANPAMRHKVLFSFWKQQESRSELDQLMLFLMILHLLEQEVKGDAMHAVRQGLENFSDLLSFIAPPPPPKRKRNRKGGKKSDDKDKSGDQDKTGNE
ncbi:hypothetical protein HY967_03455 [Candidatus Jorgensenbacteria bacterium]|nr:hypothetical protein [Candidatus Jorgensenbacteria bacterium]